MGQPVRAVHINLGRYFLKIHKAPFSTDRYSYSYFFFSNQASVKQSRPVPQSFGKLRKDDAKLFNVDIHTAKQLRHFKYATMYLLVSLISSPDFVMQVLFLFQFDSQRNLIPPQSECFQGYIGMSLSVRLYVCVSIFVQNTSNFVLQTPPAVLLQLY